MKSWKKTSSKVNAFFSLQSWPSQTAQTEELMFQNVQLIDQLCIKLGCSIRMCTMYIPIFCSYKFKHNKVVLRAICYCLTTFTLKWGRIKLKVTFSNISDFLRRPEKFDEMFHLICFLLKEILWLEISSLFLSCQQKKWNQAFLSINNHIWMNYLLVEVRGKKDF